MAFAHPLHELVRLGAILGLDHGEDTPAADRVEQRQDLLRNGC